MPIRNETSILIDGLLKAAGVAGITLAVLMAPNALQILDKPLQKYFKKLNHREREREFRRLIGYMHREGLVTGHYDHGLKITDKALKRLKKLDLDTLKIPYTRKWDKRWRIIFYDIPESQKKGRDELAFRLRKLGCQQLQRSVWIHPFPCEEQVNTIATACGVENTLTYLESTHINNGKALIDRFSHLF